MVGRAALVLGTTKLEVMMASMNSASGGGDDEVSSKDGNDEQSADEEDVPKPPTASTRFVHTYIKPLHSNT